MGVVLRCRGTILKRNADDFCAAYKSHVVQLTLVKFIKEAIENVCTDGRIRGLARECVLWK